MAVAPVKPYEGKEPYIFISYSHKDSDGVFPILKYLDEKGYRLWYDEGIDPGTEWPESIAQHLMHSAVCIAFVSENSLASQNCRREINFALSRSQIGFLSVMLENAKMTPGVELQLSTYQSLLMYKYPQKEEFYNKLSDVDLLEPCKRPQPVVQPVAKQPVQTAAAQPTPVKETRPETPVPQKAEKPAKPIKTEEGGGKNKKMMIIGGAAVAVIALIIAIIAMTSGKSDPDPTKSAESTPAVTQEAKESEKQTAEESKQATEAASEEQTETPAEEAPLTALSDKLSDYTFKLDDVVYQLPFDFKKLTDNGWTISSSGISDQSMVDAEGEQSFNMVRNGATIGVLAVNVEEEAKAVADCQVAGIELQQKDLQEPERFCIAKGINLFSTLDEIKEAFGTGADISNRSNYTQLTYGSTKKRATYFEVYSDTTKYNQIALVNYPAAKQAERRTELSDDLADATFKLDGTVYQLPFAFTELTDNGWTISSSGVSDKTKVGGYDHMYIDMTKNGAKVTVYAVNASGNARAVGDCLIGAVEVQQSYILDAERFCIAKGITPFSSEDDIKAALGEPDNGSEYSNYVVMTYGNPSDYRYARSYVYSAADQQKYNKITLSNYPTEPEPTDTVEEVPEYLAAYVAPTSLGEDLFSGIAEIDGDLYQLPAPVSAFLDNGWTITRKSGYIAAFGSDSVTLQREGAKLEIRIKNFSEYQTVAENCAVTKAEMNADDAASCALPQEIGIGTRKSFVDDKEIDFYTSDFTNYHYYSKTSKETNVSVSLRVDKETDQVSSITVEAPDWKY